MIYSFDINTEKNTLASSPKVTTMKLTYGIIHQLDIIFPAGLSGLAGISLWRGSNQVWPTNPAEYFHTDDEILTFKESYKLYNAPFVVEAHTYNEDDTYNHSIIIRFGMLRRNDILGLWRPWGVEDLR